VLTTSRARLRVPGEQVYDVLPLALDSDDPAARPDAIVLFEQAAQAVGPGFDVERHLDDVITICRAVDGLPLAIELAAGHVRTLSPPLLRARLSQRLGSVSGASRGAHERQQTVPSMIDWTAGSCCSS
jgi:non-specific serine/threonine protein kinase